LIKNVQILAGLSLATMLAACASSGGPNTTRSAPTRITRYEIANSNASNAYELITRLRPAWLRPQGTGSVGGGVVRSQGILVYLNRQRLEDLDALKTISVDGIDSAEWIDAARVQTVLSDVPSGSFGGAIVVKTK
jgi:hypothetical protein